MIKIKNIFVISLLLWVCSCVEPFSLVFNTDKIVLTVDATLTDLDEPQSIKIVESVSYKIDNYPRPVTKAKVELLIDKKERVPFVEQGNGIYALPPTFRTKPGSTYQLFIERENGTSYQSGEETLVLTSDITKTYDDFVLKGIPRGEDYDPAHYIYIDTPDPADQKNNYMWSWKLWELQIVCITCANGRYQSLLRPPGCKEEAEYNNTKFDYYCDGDCWDIFTNKELNVFSDIYSNGKTITGRLIAKIPYYQEGGSLIEIKQQSISPEAYRYMKLLADQTQNSGSLVDTPPAAIIGNVRNISDNTEPVAGFFMVTSIKKTRYWISRKNAIGKAKPIGLLGYIPTPEPAGSGQLGRPPLVPCIEGPTRTKIKPEGWLD